MRKLDVLSTGLDVVIASMFIIHALGGTIPWFLWFWAAGEIAALIHLYWKERGDK